MYKKLLVSMLIVGAFSFPGYQLGLYILPYMIMNKTESAIAERAGGVNKMHHPPLPTATARTVVKPSPDQFYSACVYDLSKGAVLVSGHAILDSYWSLSFFQHNTDVFYMLNDQQLQAPKYNILLVRSDVEIDVEHTNSIVVRSPSVTGIILQRVFVDSDLRKAELDVIRKSAKCEIYTEYKL